MKVSVEQDSRDIDKATGGEAPLFFFSACRETKYDSPVIARNQVRVSPLLDCFDE